MTQTTTQTRPNAYARKIASRLVAAGMPISEQEAAELTLQAAVDTFTEAESVTDVRNRPVDEKWPESARQAVKILELIAVEPRLEEVMAIVQRGARESVNVFRDVLAEQFPKARGIFESMTDQQLADLDSIARSPQKVRAFYTDLSRSLPVPATR